MAAVALGAAVSTLIAGLSIYLIVREISARWAQIIAALTFDGSREVIVPNFTPPSLRRPLSPMAPAPSHQARRGRRIAA